MFNSSSRKAIVPARAELRRHHPSATIERRYSLRFLNSTSALGPLPWGLHTDEPIPVNEPQLAQQSGYTVVATSTERYELCLLLLDDSRPIPVSAR